MHKLLIAIVAVLASTVLPASHLSAGIDEQQQAPITATPYELVVMEADGCIYCRLFRRDVLPAFETSQQGREMPVRFVDINDVEKSSLDLDAPVQIVPTFIVVRDKKEVGRIAGYMGPENFYHSINYLMSSAP